MTLRNDINFIRQILFLKEINQTGSILQTALRNGMKASNLSHMMKEFENIVGFQLLLRSYHGVSLTPNALELLKTAAPLFEAVKRTQRIASVTETVYFYLPANMNKDFLKDFRQKNPHIQVMLSSQKICDVGFYIKPRVIKPPFASFSIQVHNLILKQRFYIVYRADKQGACLLADFIRYALQA